jgi:hypothetical protein
MDGRHRFRLRVDTGSELELERAGVSSRRGETLSPPDGPDTDPATDKTDTP